jgi:hypothetical protein
MANTRPGLIVTIARWAARIIGALMVLLFAVMFIGEAVMVSEPFPGLTLVESLEMAAVVVMLAGALMAWRWEILGGALCLAGGIFFVIVESVQENRLRLVWFPVVFAAIGVTFILCRLASRPRSQASADAT